MPAARRLPLTVAVLAGLVPLLAPATPAEAAAPEPAILDLSPVPGEVTAPGPVVITARATALDDVSVRLDGDLLPVGGDGVVAAAGFLLPGRRTIEVAGITADGRQARRSWHVMVAEPLVELPGPPLLSLATRVQDAVRRSASPPDTEPAPGAEVKLPLRVTATVDRPVDAERSQAYLAVGDEEVPLTLRADGGTLVAELGTWPRGPHPGGAVPARFVAEVVATGPEVSAEHVDIAFTVRLPPVSPTPEGFLLAGGSGHVVGAGPVRTYSLEVEPGLDVGPLEFAREAERLLSDPRGWTAPGDVALQRVGSPDASLRVVLASPGTVDRFCAAAGLDTGGWLSCWNGRFAMLNADRWREATQAFTGDLATYRGYLVNHEVGHGLGKRHADCPAEGAPAPVMMQQSKGLAGCLPNAWPHP